MALTHNLELVLAVEISELENMEGRSLVVLFLAALGVVDCVVPSRQGGGVPARLTDERREAVRKQELAAEEAEKSHPLAGLEDQQIDSAEQELIRSLRVALGKEPMAPGVTPLNSSGTILTQLRSEPQIKLKIEPILDRDGKPVSDNFLQLKDSSGERLQQLSGKIQAQTLSRAEMKEVQAGAKYAGELNALRQQVTTMSMVTMTSNSILQSSSMTTMLRVANLVRARNAAEMEMDADDYSRVKKWMARQRRIETIAAVSLGVLATYHGVVNRNIGPKALDLAVEKALEALPVKTTIADDEAKGYVKNLKGNVVRVKAQYEAMLREVHGNARYEQQYKSGIDAMFAQAAAAHEEQLATGVANGTRQRSDVAVGSEANGSRSGDVFGSLPGFNVIKASVEGVAALVNGDSRGALDAAVGLVPGGGQLRDAFTQVLKMM